MENRKTQGLMLIDVDVVALNNAGKSTMSNFDNGVATKSILKNGKRYVYVSGQAWRYWWRESLQRNLNWEVSPVVRESKVAFTQADPVTYPDDDLFGYMKAATEVVTDPRGREKSVNVTVTRASPLKNSAIVSVAAVRPVESWSVMARQEGDAVPYAKQEYSAVMKGMFSLDLNMVGTFSNYNRSGFQNLSDALRKKALDAGAIEIDDPFVPGKKLVRLPGGIRRQRVTDALRALKYLSGGAMQADNMADVSPKLIVLATTTTGNHPFTHILKTTGEWDEVAALNIEGLSEVLREYRDIWVGKIFVGRRSGFLDDEKEALDLLAGEFSDLLVVGSVNEMIDAYCDQVKIQVNL